MKILNDSIVRDHYDVIVVGAGMGGLTSAALLAKKGLSVLVIEQHYLPGGNCSAIRRQDVTMDVGAAMLFGFGEAGYNPPRFIMNELEEDIDLIPHESIYRMQLDGRQITFWRDMDRFLEELIAEFPHQDKEIRAVYAELKEFYDIMVMTNEIPVPPTEIPPLVGMISFFKHPIGTLKLLKYMFKSEEDVLMKYITDPKLISLFDLLTATYTCCNTQESPAILAATMFIDNHVGGACYPSGSPQMLPNIIEKALEKNGGRIIYKEKVHEILIWKKKVYGVRLENGTEITADRVISNATVWNLYGKLINRRHVTPKQKKWADSFESTKGAVLLYLSVKEEGIPVGTRPIEMLAGNPFDLEMGNNYVIFIPSLDDPTIAPPGSHSVSVICPYYVKWPSIDDRYYRSDDYYKLKEEIAERSLDDLERMYFPKLRENIITMDIGTPSTFERYTLRNNGCIGGPKLTMKQNFFSRLRARSEWKNLYCVGDSTAMGEGVISAMVSGVGAANAILQDMKKPIYKYRDFPREYVNLVKGRPWTPPPAAPVPITEENASRAAKECQHCDSPGCVESCPAGINACYFARRIEAKNYKGAALYLRDVNPFAEICGYVCPSERYCEKNCNRHDFSETPVRIRELHAWVCGYMDNSEGWDLSPVPKNGKRIAVIGAGPAGLTAAHYLARLGYEIDIYDRAAKPGGMLSHALPEFRLGREIIEREIDGLSVEGMNFNYGMELGKDFTLNDFAEKYSSVFLAPGLWSGRSLDIPGLDTGRVIDALSYLKAARGEGRAKTGNNALIIGGGSVAADAALTAKKNGAQRVTLVCLEGPEEMPCLMKERIEMEAQGIIIENGWGPQKAVSSTSVSFTHCTNVFDESGCFNPEMDPGCTKEFEFDQLIIAIGQDIDPALSEYIEKEFGTRSRIIVNENTLQVNGRPGIFAGGDIIRGAGTVAEAVGDGRKAAIAIDEFIKRGGNIRADLKAEGTEFIEKKEKAEVSV